MVGNICPNLASNIPNWEENGRGLYKYILTSIVTVAILIIVVVGLALWREGATEQIWI